MSFDLSVYEKIGIFYLGREVDRDTLSLLDKPFLYKSKNLTTHAVIIGMTGSGKTGLGIDIIEEAAIDNIPSIIIDPKGDMGNLLLTFPNLSFEDFLPWVDESEAKAKGLSREEYAKNIASMWREGIKSWGQSEDRIKRLKESADFTIYTPGSRAGVSLSILSGFNAPSKDILNDPDLFSSHITSAVLSLLSLVGVKESLSSREFMLLASIFSYFWKEGRDLSLEEIIGYVINPPFDKVGVLPLKSFYPQKERFELAALLNTIISNPSFSVWSEGESLDIQKLLYTKDAKPKVSIISIAHLNDNERMFFVTLFLNRYIDWMRKQKGSSSLRTILYMDEIFGFFPSTSNPPSKEPMLLLLKQARAFGVGIVLSTQNPIDLDYKGLSNIGSWFIGRLQTKQDKERILSNLVSASEEGRDKKEIETLLSNLKSRTFLFKSAKEDELTLFQTRWVLSYLRGPITSDEIKILMKEKKKESKAIKESGEIEAKKEGEFLKAPPSISEDIENLFLNPPYIGKESFIFYPYLIFEADVRFFNQKRGIDIENRETLSLYLDRDLKNIDPKEARKENISKRECDKRAVGNSLFAPLPPFINSFSKRELIRLFDNFLYHNRKLTLYRVLKLKMESDPKEEFSDFKVRVADRLKELYEEELEKLKRRYEKEQERLERKLQRAKAKLEKEKEDVSSKTTETILGFGMTLLDAFLGRKRVKKSTAARAVGSLRSAGRVLKEKADVERAEEEVEAILKDMEDLEERLREDIDKLSEKYNIDNYEIEEFYIKPRRSDIYNENIYLCWRE